MSLKNKVVVITGAASGIGAETAKLAKSAGARVIGLDRNEAHENVDEYIAVDLSDPGSIESAVGQLPQGIDVVCNVAGLPPTAGRVPVLKVNALGLMALTEGLLEKLNDGASIVNVASLAGFGWGQSVASIKQFLQTATFENLEAVCNELDISDARSYFFSKEVLLFWTHLNRWTWRDRGIRMNCVSPGPVDTPILQDFIETMGERAEEDMRIMDRPGTPQDIAPVIQFLMSDESAWIRGSNIPCDGGMNAHILCQMHDS